MECCLSKYQFYAAGLTFARGRKIVTMDNELAGMSGSAGDRPEIFSFDKENELLKGRSEKAANLVDAVWDALILGIIMAIYDFITRGVIGVSSTFFSTTAMIIYFWYCMIKQLANGIIYWKYALIPYYPYIVKEGDTLKVIICTASDMDYLLKSRKLEEEPEKIPKELLRGEYVNGFSILEYHNCRYMKESRRFYYFKGDARKKKNVKLKLPKIYCNHDRLKQIN